MEITEDSVGGFQRGLKCLMQMNSQSTCDQKRTEANSKLDVGNLGANSGGDTETQKGMNSERRGANSRTAEPRGQQS